MTLEKRIALLLALVFILASCSKLQDDNDMTNGAVTMTDEEIKAYELQFSSNIRQQANTAINTPAYDEIEKQIVYYINLARLSPKIFAQTFVANFSQKSGQSNSTLFDERKRSLIDYLSNMEPLEALVTNDTLWHFAIDLSIAASELNLNTIDRSKTDCISTDEGYFSEIICNGKVNNGLWYVLDLLVDANEKGSIMKNRRILLDMDADGPKTQRKYIGVSYSEYKGNAILDFWNEKERDHYHLGDAMSGYDIETLENQFSSEIRQQANTAKDVDYLTHYEKELFYYVNLARIAPKQFGEIFIANYNHKPGYKLGYAFEERKKSLMEYLSTMEPLNALIPDETLFGFADCFATEGGKQDLYGHNREQTGCVSVQQGYFSECISYGHIDDTSLWKVMDLLIDTGENNAALGHRRIMLDIGKTTPESRLKWMGVAFRGHKTFDGIAVLDFWSEESRSWYERRN